MKQKTAATIFTAIIFIACLVVLKIHFDKPTASETIVKEAYYIDNLQTPQIKGTGNSNYTISVTATQGPELYVEITNHSAREVELNEKVLLYRVYVDNTRVKVDEKPIKIPIIRGYGRSEIVKAIPSQATREPVFDCSSLGAFTPGSYVISILGQNIFFTLEDNPAV